jgi:dihydrofolate synthase/folylpolyglutamate synthase
MRGVDELEQIPKFSTEIGLDRCKEVLFLNKLNRSSFPWIHIAGTKGKGSTSVFLANILEASGYKTGLFLSPHLQSIQERISINLKTITPDEMESLYQKTKGCIPEKYQKSLNFFEIITVMAFLYFTDQQVDVAVIETGLGGRLDATSAVENPIQTIISTLGFDHTERLGITLESITYEKAGIIKTGVPIICASQPRESFSILNREAKLMRSPIFFLDKDYKVDRQSKGEGRSPEVFDLYSNVSTQRYQNLTTHMLGIHQIKNASLALASAEGLQKDLPKITSKTIFKGLDKAFIPGRFEICSDPNNPNLTIILDGAHNPDSAKMLSETLKERFSNRKIYLLVSILKNKLLEEIITQFLQISPIFQFTSIPNHDTYKEEDYKTIWRRKGLMANFTFVENFVVAYQSLVKTVNKEDILCITGSLYFVGLMREYFNYLPCSLYEQDGGGLH